MRGDPNRSRSELLVVRTDGDETVYMRGKESGTYGPRRMWTPHRHEARVFKHREPAERMAAKYEGAVVKGLGD